MANRSVDGVLQSLCKLVESHAQLTDDQLLHRFAAHRDEDAFAVLLQRHGRLVYGVCRNILRHEHDVEDAFQGTFLVLARRAGAIREEKAIKSWLYRVAYRVAMKAKKAAERRRRQENQAAKPPEERANGELAWRELQAILDEELNRLPEKYRAPFVLCCLSGMSKAEAAAELGWKEGTVSSRLAQARALLQARLARRGVTLSAVLSGLAVAQQGASAAVPAALLETTRKAALAFAAGEAPAAASASAGLAKAVLWRLSFTRLKVAAVILAVLGLIATAGAVVLNQPLTPPPDPPDLAHRNTPPPPEQPKPVVPEPDDPPIVHTMSVAGSVVGPAWKAIPGAQVAVVVSRRGRSDEVDVPGLYSMQVLGQGRTDEQGQYHLAVPQTTPEHYRLTAYAAAPGYALGSSSVDPANVTDTSHTFRLRLVRGQTASARLVDRKGKPAAGVPVHILGMSRNVGGGVVVLHQELPVPLPGWPNDVKTDDDGVFTLRDIAPETTITFQVRDERFAVEWLSFVTPGDGGGKRPDITLSPGRTLEGRITADDTGQPLADATVVVRTMYAASRGSVAGRTDRDGRYRLRPFACEHFQVEVYPPDGSPYLVTQQIRKWPADSANHKVDLAAQSGVLVRGTVREVETGRPVPNATVHFEWCVHDNPFYGESQKRWSREQIHCQSRDARSAADGSFAIAVPPGPGHLVVKAASPDYLHTEVSSGWLWRARNGGAAYFPDALVPLSLQPTDGVQERLVLLRRGVTVRGRAVGSDGRPVPSAMLVVPTYIPEGWEVKAATLPVRDGRFEVPGCEPNGKVRVWIYNPKTKEGAAAEFAADADSEPVVKLKPCVSAHVRIVDEKGAPVKDPQASLDLVFRQGDEVNDSLQRGTVVSLIAWTQLLFGRDQEPTRTDVGELSFAHLIPGATYNLRVKAKQGWPPVLSFTAPDSGTKDLGAVNSERRLSVTQPTRPK